MPVSMLNQVGSVVCVAMSAFVVPWTPPSFPIAKMLDEPGRNASACWSTCTGTCAAAVGITAGGIVPDGSCARCKPDVESVEEDAVRIVWIHGDSLVVPVLWIVAGGILAVSERAALRTFHVSPACAAIRGSPGAELAARCASATAIAIPDDGLPLRINVIRVTRRDSDIDASELVAGRSY